MRAATDIIVEEPGRRAIGSLFRDLLEILRAAGQLDAVRAAVGPTTQKLIEHPPWALAWIAADEFDDLLEALARTRGRQAVVELGLKLARKSAGALLKPLVRTLVAVAGASPATIYDNLDGLYTVTVRGFSFEWRAEGEDQGVVLLGRLHPPAPDGVLDLVEGTLLLAPELCGSTGTVTRCEAPPDFAAAWSVRWQPRAR